MTARIAIFDGAGQPFRLEERPLPGQLDPGAVLVQISTTTICGSDLHTHAGRRAEPSPSVLGHEAVGRVVATGPGRDAWLGRRITWASTDCCGACAACREWDLPQKCASVFKYGHALVSESQGLTGTYATHLVLRRGTHLVEIPPEIPDVVAASANCSLATMVHAVEQRPTSCRVALVIGAGLLGLHGCALLRASGVPRVLVAESDLRRRARIADFGGVAVDPADLHPQSVDVVVDATGDPVAIGASLGLLRPGGMCTLVGSVHAQAPLPVTGEVLVRGCVTMRGVHNYAARHLDAAIAFLRGSSLPWPSIVGPPLPLDRIDEAFALAATRQWARVAVYTSS